MLFIIFLILYITPIFFTAPNPAILERYDLSALQLKFIMLTIVVFLAVIWYSAFYGFVRFKEYAVKIIDSSDGQAFNALANGLGLLAISFPVSALIAAGFGYISQINPALNPATVITERYIVLALAAIAFMWIYKGSKRLLSLTSKKFKPSFYFWLSILLVFTMGGLYAYVALTNTADSVTEPISRKAVYYLPPPLIITTYVIPYVCIWMLGLRSIAFILFFSKKSKGLVYRRALGYLAAGLSLVVSGSIATQLLTAIGNAASHWGLQLLLALVYLLVIAIAAGYLLIAVGAKKLKKIEEV